MSIKKKLLLSISVMVIMLMAVVMGIAMYGSKPDVSTPNAPSSTDAPRVPTIKIKQPKTYYYNPGDVRVVEGEDEINYTYIPSNDVKAGAGVAYEYVIGNPTDEETAINLKSIDTTDVTVTYYYSNIHLETVPSGEDVYEMQKLPTKDSKKYIYIIVTPKNTEIPASFATSVVWYYGKPGQVVYNVQGSSPVTVDIIKGQPTPKLNAEVEEGYVLKYYTDSSYTQLIDMSEYSSQGGVTIYVRAEQASLTDDWFEYVENQGGDDYYKVVKGEQTLAELGLTDIEIPATYTKNGVTAPVTTIGDYDNLPFRGDTTIASITIPASVTSLSTGAFKNCTNLKTVTFEQGSQITSLGDLSEHGTFENCTSLTSINLDALQNLTHIYLFVFKNCSSLKSLTIPASVVEMSSPSEPAFLGCSGLTSVVFNDLDWWVANNGSSEGVKIIIEPEDLADPAKAAECLATTYVQYMWTKYDTEPTRSMEFEGVYDMENSNHYHKLISVGNIKSSDITIPASHNDNGSVGTAPVSAIHKDAFNGHELTSVTFENPGDWYVTQSESDWNNKTGGTAVDVSNPSTNALHFKQNYVGYYWYKVKTLNYEFVNEDGGYYAVTGYTGTGAEVVIPSTYNDYSNGEASVKAISSRAFYQNTTITSVTIPNTVTEIGESAFYECTSLASLTFEPTSQLATINDNAFFGCSALTTTLPASVTTIVNLAFNQVNLSLEDMSSSWQIILNGSSSVSPDIYATSDMISAVTTTSSGTWVKLVPNLPSQWLQLGGDGTYYVVVDGTQNGGSVGDLPDDLIIPSTYNNIPVTEIAYNAFSDLNSATAIKAFNSVLIPASVNKLNVGAFCGQSCTITMADTTSQWETNTGNAVSASDAASYTKSHPSSGIPYSYCVKRAPSPESGGLPSEWLQLSGDGTYYIVVDGTQNGGSSSDLPNNLTIQSSYNSIPVTEISYNAFYNYDSSALRKQFDSIRIPESITKIHIGAFYSQSCTITMDDTTSQWGTDTGETIDASTAVSYASNHRYNGIPYSYCVKGGVAPESGELPSEWLQLSGDGTYYMVVDGTQNGGSANLLPNNLTIQSSYNSIPVTTITDGAFCDYHNSVVVKQFSSITIPESITKIYIGAYWGQNNCTIIMEDTTSQWKTDTGESVSADTAASYGESHPYSGIPYGYCVKVEVPYPEATLTDSSWFSLNSAGTEYTVVYGSESELPNDGVVVIPETYGANNLPVTSIGGDAFYECNITSITIPRSVTSIESYAFDCCGLTSIDLSWCTSLTRIETRAFSYCTLNSIDLSRCTQLTSIGSYAFESCISLTSVNLSKCTQLTSIGSSAFYNCSSLTSVNLNKCTQLTSIEEATFEGCSSLTSIDLSKCISLTTIGSIAFLNCSSLTSINIPEGVISVDCSSFSRCSSLTSMVVDSNNQVYDSRNNCNAIIETASNTLILGCKSTIIPDTITSIGDAAFSDCSGLTSINIPEGVTSIGDSAFKGCGSLTSIVIPAGVTSIGYSAFSGCSSLTSINIPAGVTSIGHSAFQSCTSLTSIDIPAGVTSIGYSAFSGCSSLTRIDLSKCTRLTSIGHSAFQSCSNLTSITLPSSLTSIGYSAFYNCSSLTSITIPSSVNSIGTRAFYGCSKLTITFGLTSGWYRTTSSLSTGYSVTSSNLSTYMTSTYKTNYFYNTTAGGSYTNYN